MSILGIQEVIFEDDVELDLYTYVYIINLDDSIYHHEVDFSNQQYDDYKPKLDITWADDHAFQSRDD